MGQLKQSGIGGQTDRPHSPRGRRAERALFVINVDIFQADDAQARGQVFVVGDQALVVDGLDQFRQRDLLVGRHPFKDVPERPFQAQGRAVAVDSKAALFRDELLDLIGRAGIEHMFKHIVRFEIDRHAFPHHQ